MIYKKTVPLFLLIVLLSCNNQPSTTQNTEGSLFLIFDNEKNILLTYTLLFLFHSIESTAL